VKSPWPSRSGARWLAAAACTLLAHAAAAQDDLDDILGGFEDEDPAFEVAPPPADEPAFEPRWWDVSGSLEVSGTVNYLHHESATGTNYFGLQRLRGRANLQLDADLSKDWKARAEGWAFYDTAYAINGRSRYTDEVLSDYEFDAQVGEVWVHGRLLDWLDLKVGRQIVIWGRSESLRVLDVLNPLDNREPGRVDIEDLRLPTGMVRLDAYQELWGGDWNFSAIAIPELRFDRNPPVGSDFNPATFAFRKDTPKDFKDTEVAASLAALFRGWDFTLNGAWYWNDFPRFEAPAGPGGSPRLTYDRLWMVGASGNFTTGPWLLKAEAAYLDGFRFVDASKKARVDVLIGIEYYGISNVSISIEGVNRHLFDYVPELIESPTFTRKNSQQIALRYTQNFLNEKLEVTALAVILGYDGRDGSIVRLSADYDIRDALTAGIGILLYQSGDLPPLSSWGQNDRLIFNVKWSF